LGNARLEQSRADAEAQRVSTAMDQAQKEYQKQTERLAKGATPRRVFEAAERDYTARLEEYKLANKGTNAAAELVQLTQRTLDNARRDLDEKSQRLEELGPNSGAAEVVSPVDGWVAGHNGDPGTLAQEQGDRLVQIATDLVSLEVPLEPEPPVLNRVKPGVRAVIQVSELNQPIDGEVKRIDGTVVVVQFTSPSSTVRPGMKAEVRLKLP
jgi:multidrug resistance efflux pump